MATIQELERNASLFQPSGQNIGLQPGQAYSSYFPTWETQTPQYINPSVYSVETQAYRQNEFVYSLIVQRAQAESKGHFQVWDGTKDPASVIKDHKLRQLIKHPNKNTTEDDFWQIKRISQDLAGFAAFEVELNRLGEPHKLWFMRPDWCSFIRGLQDPLAFIRYQPWGLEPMDIPLVDPKTGATRILFFSNGEDFDPQYPGVKFLSPAMHALPHVVVDNAMTFFLADFVKHGARPAAMFSVQQTLDPTRALEMKNIWRIQHGGVENWGDPIFMGLGAEYKQIQMNFKDMAFEEMDGRTEARMCKAFQMSPVVADAKVGLVNLTYDNKKQATIDWYHDWVQTTMDKNAETVASQMLPYYHEDPDKYFCGFDVSKVYAMQEDEDLIVKRWTDVWYKRGMALDEYHEKIGLKPIGGSMGKSYYTPLAVREQEAISPEGTITDGADEAAMAADRVKGEKPQPTAKSEEIAKFRKYAKARTKEGKRDELGLYDFKNLDLAEQKALIDEFRNETDLRALADAINKAVEVMA